LHLAIAISRELFHTATPRLYGASTLIEVLSQYRRFRGETYLLAYVGFLEWEQKLLKKAATELGVAEQCEFRDDVDGFADDGTLVTTDNGRRSHPAVIFLNMNAEAGTWRESLTALKSHRVLSRVPVIGLGNLPTSDVAVVYDLGGNSYIAKPDTYDEMISAARISLTFWLEISQLPQEHLNDI